MLAGNIPPLPPLTALSGHPCPKLLTLHRNRYIAVMSSRAWRLFGVGLAFPLLAGCSSFTRDWKAAASAPMPTTDISGRWEGTWQNTNNTHRDKMRAILTRISDGEYRARFHAKYAKILGFSYATTFHGTWTSGEFVFHGEENLGKLAGGLYKYDGRISPTNFFSTYDSKHDVGTFTLKRPVK
jgi:hypothetical protein